MEEREADVTGKADDLEIKMVTFEIKVENRGNFQSARRTCEPKVGVQARQVFPQNGLLAGRSVR